MIKTWCFSERIKLDILQILYNDNDNDNDNDNGNEPPAASSLSGLVLLSDGLQSHQAYNSRLITDHCCPVSSRQHNTNSLEI